MKKRKVKPVRFDVLIFDRVSDYPNGIASVGAAGTKTHREWYLEGMGKVSFYRNDIALINTYDADNKHRGQLSVYPGRDGIPFGDGIDYLSSAQWRKCCKINAAMLYLAHRFPEYAHAMRLD